MNIIPLQGGAANAHQSFTAQLGDSLVDFRLNYIQTGQWVCDLSIEGEGVAQGLMLEPGCDMLSHYNLGIGQLVLTGDEPTLDNLGASNKLVWVPEDE